jgi:hypothetical protein
LRHPRLTDAGNGSESALCYNVLSHLTEICQYSLPNLRL